MGKGRDCLTGMGFLLERGKYLGTRQRQWLHNIGINVTESLKVVNLMLYKFYLNKKKLQSTQKS